MGYSCALLLLVCVCCVFPTLITGDEAASSLVISPHCSAKCGYLSIPYPFGIEEGCYYKPPNNETSSTFKINCNNDSKPILLEMEVLNISVEEGELRSKSRVSYDCYNKSSRVQRWFERFNLGTFTLSSPKNILVAIGCDTTASFSGFRVGLQYKTGCNANCMEPNDVINGECSGVGCCQAAIPCGVNNVTVQVDIPSNRSSVNGFNPCNVAFPVAKDAFKFNENYLGRSMEYYKALAVPVVFNWTVGRDNCSVAKAGKSCLCKGNTECYDPMRELGYRCRCKDGYSGNPYHPSGCRDIDKCKEANDCEKSEYCINTNGSYYCKCPRRYHGNGTKTSPCVSNRKPYWFIIVVMATAGLSVIFGLTLLLLFGCWLQSVSKKRKAIKQQKINFERNGGLLLQQQMSSDEGVVERIKIFTINELEKSTDHFNEDRILGRGGHGTVYKGMLSEGRIVAIKKSNKLEEAQREEFINEVVIMSQINHRNILKLLGCCLETDVPLLVYEFIPNGTLYNHIHNPNEEFPLTWKMRLHIASDSAGALAYLHSSTSTLIFHRDIKSSNILLDEKYRAKLSDFGFSRSVAIDQTRVVTRVMGTPGYLDPEYFQSHQYTEKSDVYSFGVVLVELLTGQKAVRAAFEEDRSLISWFLSHMENSSVLNIIDSQVLLEGSKEEFLAIANLAKQCLILDGKRRPTMKEVWLEIDRILSLHMPHTNDLNKPKPEQVIVGRSNSANSSTFSLGSRVLDSAELSLMFNPR